MKKILQLSLLTVASLSAIALGFKPNVVQAETTTDVSSEAIRKAITVYPDLGQVPLYDASGNKVSGVELAPNSNLSTSGATTINGEKYYQVATDWFVKASAVYTYKFTLVQVKVTAKPLATIRNVHGQEISNRAIANGTIWSVDKVIKVNGQNYYRISSNEFVSSDDVEIIK